MEHRELNEKEKTRHYIILEDEEYELLCLACYSHLKANFDALEKVLKSKENYKYALGVEYCDKFLKLCCEKLEMYKDVKE